jgi:hypothetical protein
LCVQVEATGSEMVGKYPTSSKNIGKTYSKLEAKVTNKVSLTYSKLSAIKQIQHPPPHALNLENFETIDL